MASNKTKVRNELFGRVEYNPKADTFNAYSHLSEKETLESELSAPLTLHWLVTMKCNARCPYCYELPLLLRPTSKEETINDEQAAKFVSDYAQAGGFRIYLTGGEPTLSNLTPKILALADNLGIKCVINTNGIKMPEATYEAIKKSDARLSISLDSFERTLMIAYASKNLMTR